MRGSYQEIYRKIENEGKGRFRRRDWRIDTVGCGGGGALLVFKED